MRILHCIYDHINNPWVGGGGAIRVYEMYRRIAAKGHGVTVVSGRFPGARDYTEDNIAFHFVGTFRRNYVLSTFAYALCCILKMMRFKGRLAGCSCSDPLDFNQYDIIIEDFAAYNPLFTKLLINEKPVVLQLHHKEGSNLIKRYVFFGLPSALLELSYPHIYSNIISVSTKSRDKFGVNYAKVIPNGINTSLFCQSASHGDYILYIGRIHMHNKGLDLLIKAAKSIRGRIIIAGKGRDEERLQTIIKKMGVEEKVRFIGYVSEREKIELIRNALFFVLPSRYEGQGIVVLEAAACGRPVIVSDIPELRYAVDFGFGISFESGNHEDLARKISRLIEDKGLRCKMGLMAREYARDFSWEVIAERYETYLSEVINSYGSRKG